MSPVVAPLMGIALVALVGVSAPSQELTPLRAGVGRSPGAASDRGVSLAPLDTLTGGRRPEWWGPLASAVLPGAGQAAARQDRFVGYIAVEAYAWLTYESALREGRRQRRAYRLLANGVARAFFSQNPRTGTFDYYERMQHYVESGVFDRNPMSPDVEPEVDTSTFNGTVWLLARRTFWEHPDSVPDRESSAYQQAERFYVDRAITPEFRWSWRNAQLEQDLFRRAISRSNEAYRRSIQALGIVLANHALSTVDAYVTLRLWNEEAPGALPGTQERRLGVGASVPWAPFGHRGRRRESDAEGPVASQLPALH